MAAKSKTQSKDDTICPIYVVYGKDRRRVMDTTETITKKILGDADPQLALSQREGKDLELADVLDELRTLPFLSPCRLIVVKDADPFISTYRQELESYLEAPSSTGILVLLPESFPGNTRLAKKAAQVGQVLSCEPIKPRELPGYLTGYAKDQHNLRLNRDAAELLIELAGDDSGVLSCEIDKLAAYVTGPENRKSQITLQEVQAVVGQNRLYNVFNVIDALTEGKTSQALTLLNQMLSQDRDAQFTAVGAFAWHFRRLYQARLLMDKRVGDTEIIRQVRIWSNQNQFIRQVKQYRIEKIGSILKQLMRIDHASKSGGGTVRMGLEKLILEFSSIKRRAV
jgi:DNA polymerase-3 subunit delta